MSVSKSEALDLTNDALSFGLEPRVHPNGFIQLDLDESGKKRLHVWRNDLPRQKVYTPVHNHRFDFISTTVVGALTNMTFEFQKPSLGSPHRRWVVRHNAESEETQLMSTQDLIGLTATNITLVRPGDGYEFYAGAFHETGYIHNTVTIIDKSAPVEGIESAVMIPEGIEPDNTFTRAVPNINQLRNKIKEALS